MLKYAPRATPRLEPRLTHPHDTYVAGQPAPQAGGPTTQLVLSASSAAAASACGFVLGGVVAGFLALIAMGCGLVLAERVRAAPASADARAVSGLLGTVTAFAPGTAVVFLAFKGGGFFPAAPALVAVLLLLLITLHALLAAHPFAGVSWPFALVASAMVAFAAWALASSAHSHAPYRALTEFDLALTYSVALIAFGLAGRSEQRLRAMLGGVALGAFIVCACGLITRLLPDVWHTRPDLLADQRLAYPLTYWNALGILAAVGIVFALHLTTGTRNSRWVGAAAAAALPVLAVALLFTFSRGGIAAAVVGTVLYLLVGRPRSGLTGVLATAPFVTLALVVAYEADLLGSTAARTPAATAQGHHVAIIVAVAALGAAVARLALTPIDTALLGWRLPKDKRTRVLAAAWIGGVVLVVAISLAAGVPGLVSRQYDRFVSGSAVAATGAPRARLTSAGDNGRLGMWKIALSGYRAAKITGHGAGTYEFRFMRERLNAAFKVSDAHSLYLELLDELGLVGLVLVGLVLVTMLGTLLLRTRGGDDRTAYAALFAAVAMWALHAGIDWDWEMPAVTLWVFALGGVALARSQPAALAPGRTPLVARLLVAAACAAAAILPSRLALTDAHLGDATLAYQRGDCPRAAKQAHAAAKLDADAAQAYEIQGICAARAGRPIEARDLLREAVRREPDNWHFHYVLAVVDANGGNDPRSDALAASNLNPLAPVTRLAVRAFASSRPLVWRRRAAPLLQATGLAQNR